MTIPLELLLPTGSVVLGTPVPLLELTLFVPGRSVGTADDGAPIDLVLARVIKGDPGEDGAPGPPGPIGASSSIFRYKADGTSTNMSDPGTGKIRWNHADQTQATMLCVDRLTADGFDSMLYFQVTQLHDRFIIQDEDLSLNYQVWEKTGDAVPLSDYFLVPVASRRSAWTARSARPAHRARARRSGSATRPRPTRLRTRCGGARSMGRSRSTSTTATPRSGSMEWRRTSGRRVRPDRKVRPAPLARIRLWWGRPVRSG
jgi:hypothetical protein